MNLIGAVIQELYESFKGLSDFAQYLFKTGMKGPLFVILIAALLLSGKGGKGFKLGKWLDIKL